MAKRDSMCGTKQPHKSEGAAWAHVRSLRRRFPKEDNRIPYVCPYCIHPETGKPSWHVGRPNKKKLLTKIV